MAFSSLRAMRAIDRGTLNTDACTPKERRVCVCHEMCEWGKWGKREAELLGQFGAWPMFFCEWIGLGAALSGGAANALFVGCKTSVDWWLVPSLLPDLASGHFAALDGCGQFLSFWGSSARAETGAGRNRTLARDSVALLNICPTMTGKKNL